MIEFLKIWAKESWELLKFLCFLLGIGKFVEELLINGADLAVESIGRLLASTHQKVNFHIITMLTTGIISP